MVGRVRSLGILRTGDPNLDRVQDHVKQQLDPVLQNTLLSAVDFRWIEVQGADPTAAPTFALQYRSATTVGGVPAWNTVASWDANGQIVSPLRGESDAGTAAPALSITSASGWTDVPTTSSTFVVKSAVRKIKAVTTFAGFVSAAASLSIRWVSDGAMISQAYNFFYNTANQHQAWAFQWVAAAGALGAIGTSHTVKAQVLVNSAAVTLTMNSDDHATFVVEEIG